MTVLTIEQLRSAFGQADQAKKDRETREETGIYETTVEIVDLDLEDCVGKNDSQYQKLILSYKNLSNNTMQTRKIPTFTPEAQMLVMDVGVEVGSKYKTTMEKNAAGYWNFKSFELISEGEK